MSDDLKKAVLYRQLPDKKVRCDLCSFRCEIAEGRKGRCGVRINSGGVLYSLVYDKICSAGADPVEKKPLYHFQPGTCTFSIATQGCNFKCDFCQNFQISQSPADGCVEGFAYSPEKIVSAALESGCSSIAYTYTEPTIFMEVAADTARLAKKAGLKNIFVSNGYMTKEAVDYMDGFLDAINIDLKAFSDSFYKTHCKARLEPVLDTIKYVASRTSIWMELTTLIIQGENDSDDEMKELADFIVTEAGADVPWHISRFYPQYKMFDKQPTKQDTLKRAFEIGAEAGLRYIYVGNLPSANSQSTFCCNCKELVIERSGYIVTANKLVDSLCPNCSTKIAGVGL